MSKYNYFNLVAARGGYLVSHLYDLLPNSKPCYATFLKELRATPGLYVSKAVCRSNSLFVSTDRRSVYSPAKFNVDNMRLLIMAGEFEVRSGFSKWFVPERSLLSVYRAFKASYGDFYGLDDSISWFTAYDAQKRSILASKGSIVSLVDKPGYSLLNLHRMHIYLELRPGKPVPLRFFYLDVKNNINKNSFRVVVAAVLEFIAYHKIDLPFDIVALCWGSDRVDNLIDTFSISEDYLDRLSNKNIRYNYKSMFLKNMKKVHFVSLDLNGSLSYNPQNVLNNRAII